MKLFEELTGMGWYDDIEISVDQEKKITEFDYEDFLHPAILKDMDTKSPEFKQLIRYLNYNTKTKFERL